MSKQISKIYHAAIYVRLSKEDGDVSTSAKLRVIVFQIKRISSEISLQTKKTLE